MSIEHETAVRAFIEEWTADEWDAAQVERVLGHLAPGAKYCVYAWEEPLTSLDAIRNELLRQAQEFRGFRSEIVTIGSVGSTVFTERLDSMTIMDKPVTFHAAGVFEVDDNGKIAAWRDYLDSKEVATKLGTDISSAGTRD